MAFELLFIILLFHFLDFLKKIPLIFSVDSFDVRGIDVGSVVSVSVRIDGTGGSSLWHWCLLWVRKMSVYVIPVKTFPSVTGIFFASKTGMGLGCTIYIIQMNLLLPLGGKKVICPPE